MDMKGSRKGKSLSFDLSIPVQGTASGSGFFSGLTISLRETPNSMRRGLATSTEE
jgi:hypothetical protein